MTAEPSAEALDQRARALAARTRDTWVDVRAVLFGDRFGVTLFLAFLAYLVFTWRVGEFFNDVNLFVAALERLADGHLALGAPGDLDTGYPGMYYEDGLVYARNYGQVVAAVPAYWLVEALGGTAVRAGIVVGWSALLFAVAARTGAHLGRRRLGLAAGVVVAVAGLLANVLTFKPSLPTQTAILALQLSTIPFAAFTGVLLYRLLARRYDATVGVFAGAATVLASPIGFWGTVPKRHAVAAFFVVLALYALARSREADGGARLGPAGFRGVAYASAGLLAWVHAPEGFTLFLALAIVDLPTGARDRRTLAVVGSAFALSLLPFLATNYLISGNPLEPPRFLRSYNGPASLPGADAAGEGSAADSPSSAEFGSDAAGGGFDPSDLLPSSFATLLQVGVVRYVEGLVVLATDFDRLRTVFLRWGVQGYRPRNVFFGGGTNLSVLESLPLAAALVVAPARYAVDAVRTRALPRPNLDVVDAFAVVFSVLLTAMYIHSLPLKVMVTVRYLHPIYPLLVYAVFRQAAVRRVLAGHATLAVSSYLATLVGGGMLTASALIALDASKGAYVQTHGLVALVAATGLAASLLAGERVRRADGLAAFWLGLAAGVTTLFTLSTAFMIMHYGPSALPFVEVVSGELRWLSIRP